MYDTLVILAERVFVKQILGDLLEKSKYQLAFQKIEPIPLLHYDKDNYCEKLFELCWLDENKGEEIVESIYSFWIEEIFKAFENRESDQIFSVKYGEAWCFLSYLFTKQLRKWYQGKQLVTIEQAEQLRDIEEALIEKEKQLTVSFQLQLEKKEKTYAKQFTKLETLKQITKQKEIISEQLTEALGENKILQTKIIIYENEKKLIGKRLACVGFNWSVEQTDQLKEQYHLKELTCYSAIEDFTKLKNVHVDYIMFYSKLATHQAFYQLKNKENVWLISSNYPKLAFEYVLENYLKNID
ncbi:hypothetical protein QMK38_18670 [Lysinibacillus fusiformis]|nr:hypothetical protein [Lysinibacillus fusiformis]